MCIRVVLDVFKKHYNSLLREQLICAEHCLQQHGVQCEVLAMFTNFAIITSMQGVSLGEELCNNCLRVSVARISISLTVVAIWVPFLRVKVE